MTDHHVVYYEHIVNFSCIVCKYMSVVDRADLAPSEEELEVISTEFKILAITMNIGPKDSRNRALVARHRWVWATNTKTGPPEEKNDVLEVSYPVRDGKHMTSIFEVKGGIKLDHPSSQKLSTILRQCFERNH